MLPQNVVTAPFSYAAERLRAWCAAVYIVWFIRSCGGVLQERLAATFPWAILS